MTSIREPALFTRLAPARRVLIAGAGGGFDVYSGLPLAFALRSQGKEVFLANLTFTYLGGTDAKYLAPSLAVVTPEVVGEERYFPERTLARWLASKGLPSTIYTFQKVGVRPIRRAYETLCAELLVDALVLVDGGTDILMRGDEAGLGTPEEDMTSLAATSRLNVPTKLVCCIGFGVDTYHGVCHAHFLENVAALEREGAYLGAFSVSRTSTEGAAFLEAVAHAQTTTPQRPSIVNGSIAAAIDGQFGNVQFTTRTNGSELFINPLMGMYFAFEMDGLVRRSLYLHMLEETDTIFEVGAIIGAFRKDVKARERREIPH